MCEFCNVWGCVCVGVLVICVLVFTVFLYCFVYVYLFLFVTSVRTTATERKLNCSKYEGKSLNNRNFITTFLREYLQKLFVSYFST